MLDWCEINSRFFKLDWFLTLVWEIEPSILIFVLFLDERFKVIISYVSSWLLFSIYVFVNLW